MTPLQCDSCGGTTRAGALYCSTCGQAVSDTGTRAQASSGSAGIVLLLAASLLLFLVGAAYLTQITAGVGAIAAACLFGIYARLYQAHRQHRESLASHE